MSNTDELLNTFAAFERSHEIQKEALQQLRQNIIALRREKDERDVVMFEDAVARALQALSDTWNGENAPLEFVAALRLKLKSIRPDDIQLQELQELRRNNQRYLLLKKRFDGSTSSASERVLYDLGFDSSRALEPLDTVVDSVLGLYPPGYVEGDS